MFDSPKRIRNKVNRLRKRGKFAKAVELQRELCAATHNSIEDWQTLAELATAGELADIALAARVIIAKRHAAGPAEWTQLAEAAEAEGLENEAVNAYFCAADAAARLGDCRQAMGLCETVLRLAPNHRPAQRIHGLMESRLELDDELPPGTSKKWPPERPDDEISEDSRSESISTLAGLTPDPSEKDADAVAHKETRPHRNSDVIPMRRGRPDRSTKDYETLDGLARLAINDRTAANPNEVHDVPPGSEHERPELKGPNAYVLHPEIWPSILDGHCLMFVGDIDQLGEEVLELAESIELPPHTPIYQQGKPGNLIYCLDEGKVKASRERGVFQDFGSIAAGSFFGEVNSMTDFPCTASVRTQNHCRLRVITRKTFSTHHDRNDPRALSLLCFLRDWYVEVTSNLSPLLFHCTDDELRMLADTDHWVTFAPGSTLRSEGDSGDLLTIIAGLAEVTHTSDGTARRIGHVTTGDLVGAIDPSPITVTAASPIFALRTSPRQLESLTEAAREKVAAHVEHCNRVLRRLRGELR